LSGELLLWTELFLT